MSCLKAKIQFTRKTNVLKPVNHWPEHWAQNPKSTVNGSNVLVTNMSYEDYYRTVTMFINTLYRCLGIS